MKMIHKNGTYQYIIRSRRGKPLLTGGLRLGYKWGSGRDEMALFGRTTSNRRRSWRRTDSQDNAHE
jgi:hypothetical protein